ncbi:helix-turn-helix domain-containing protein [Leptobacterium flavescens]|uniref:Helix-turn-helix domain-containing protein n=1 Tax=Leptobacterium flavescens TaxID=472055 RepID=A0A6P0UM76_9FLAO|nr:helix-turn-helix domain-containing protein [Leptobacterium flavescens]NER12949.1 helix-turn-helix domain-containing protein [Leptobacterium flavescens]
MFSFSSTSSAQQRIQDSISDLSYQELANHFYGNEDNKEVAIVYAKEYLNRAKRDNDVIRIADGYFFISYISDESIAIKYADSIILKTQGKVPNNKFYPLQGHFIKADILYEQRRFKESLDHYVEAFKLAEQNEDIETKFLVEHRIGLIKSRLGYNEEALQIFKNYVKFNVENDYPEIYNSNYLIALFALSDSYRRNKKIDSSTYINKIGYKESILSNDVLMNHYFKFNEGVNEFHRANYLASIDSINKAIPIIRENKDKPNLAESFFYLGKSHMKLQNKELAMSYFRKVDSIFIDIGDIHPDLRESYEILINQYRNEGDLEKQLIYIERLIKVDSILNDNYKYLYDKLNKGYDTPSLLSEKEQLIHSLTNRNESAQRIIMILFSISFLFALLVFLYFKRNRQYKKKFELLIKELNVETKSRSIENMEKTDKDMGLPTEILQTILKGLNHFENNHDYIDNTVTLNGLAKTIGSNSAYVSKVINTVKQKNFSSYLNDLRVTFATKKLQTDKTYRKFTIKAIALEAGFKSPESFSKAFFKKNGIYPSFYIKHLEKNDI